PAISLILLIARWACRCCSWLMGSCFPQAWPTTGPDLRPCAQPFTTSPPLGCSTCPVMYEASLLARKTKQGATSAGWPALPMGASVPNSATCLGLKVEGISGVQMGPGATAFTRIPFFINAAESERVKETKAPLVAA